jgi:hypothetical protein
MNQIPTKDESRPCKAGDLLFPLKKIACPLFMSPFYAWIFFS